jgi:predicted permease
MPALIISSVISQKEASDISEVFLVFIVAIALYLIILPFVSYLIVKILRISLNEQGLYMFMSIFSNIGFIGFPIMSELYGEKGVFYTGIFNLVFNLAAFTTGIIIINYGSKEASKFKFEKLKTPGLILSSLAILIYFLKVSFPPIVSEAVTSVGKITTPCAMLLIGSTLSKMDIKAIFNNIKVYIFSITRQMILPILLWLFLKMFIANKFVLEVTLILLTMPVGNTAVLFAAEYDGDNELAAKTVFITTLISIITIPLVIYLCFNLWA